MTDNNIAGTDLGVDVGATKIKNLCSIRYCPYCVSPTFKDIKPHIIISMAFTLFGRFTSVIVLFPYYHVLDRVN